MVESEFGVKAEQLHALAAAYERRRVRTASRSLPVDDERSGPVGPLDRAHQGQLTLADRTEQIRQDLGGQHP
jgi:hypothetical protein